MGRDGRERIVPDALMNLEERFVHVARGSAME